MVEPGYRYEYKYLISLATAALLRSRLSGAMGSDTHAVDGVYRIRSLYFDDIAATAYYDKVSGVDERCKYRIRLYNGDDSYLMLEKKEKTGVLTHKTAQRIDRATAEALIRGDLTPCHGDAPPLLREFAAVSVGTLLRPRVLVDYTRYPFTYPESNVRITIDAEVRSGIRNIGLFDSTVTTVPVLPDGTAILEIKMDERLPAHLVWLMEDVPKQIQAVSKYCLCFDICQ